MWKNKSKVKMALKDISQKINIPVTVAPNKGEGQFHDYWWHYRKRKHSAVFDSEDSSAKKANVEINLMDSPPSYADWSQQMGRSNSSQFKTRPTQGLSAKLTIAPKVSTAKRSWQDLLPTDDEDSDDEASEDEGAIMSKKKRLTDNTEKSMPPLFCHVDGSGDHLPSEVESPRRPPKVGRRVRFNEVVEWLTKSVEMSCSMKPTCLHGTCGWTTSPTLQSVQEEDDFD